jgi:hypothetical protein
MSPKTSFPPDGIRRWFVGPDGIRSGWRVLIFPVLAYSFQKLLGMLTLAIPFLAAPLRTIASGNFVASALFVLEIRNLASAALAALIMMRNSTSFFRQLRIPSQRGVSLTFLAELGSWPLRRCFVVSAIARRRHVLLGQLGPRGTRGFDIRGLLP